MINKKDITFVVQGPIRDDTKETLQSIRDNFSDSKIILSTWEDENIIGLEYDSVIFNIDPKGIEIKRDGETIHIENTNRQILSSRKGVLDVKTKYCVKTRTDLIFENDKLINIYLSNKCKYDRDERFNFLDDRVLISSINTPNPNSFLGYVCQFSDWFYFGLTSDLVKIWDQELIERSDYLHTEDNVPDYKYKNGFNFGRFSSEQLISLSFINKYMEVNPSYFRDKNYIQLTDDILLSEFIVAEPNRIGFTFKKYEEYCKIKINIKDVKSYLAFYSVTTNYLRWKLLGERKNKRNSLILNINNLLCKVVAYYLKKKVYKL